MGSIPITFDHNGKTYAGHFSAVCGAGANVWHLIDAQNYYLGRLRITRDEWVFDTSSKTGELSDLAEKFGEYLTASYG
jgi:hypothetical protein